MNNKILIYLLSGFVAIITVLILVVTLSSPQTTPEDVTNPTSEANQRIVQDASETSDSNSNILEIVIVVLSATTFISVAISFYLYKWRKVLLTDSKMALPEDWAKHMQAVGTNLHQLARNLDGGITAVVNEVGSNSNKISNMTTTYMELQDALDEKDKEIKRLREGYDAQVFKRFISRFVRIEQSVNDLILDEGEKESFLQLQRLFEDAFDECGVSKFEPEVGEDYRVAFGVADNPKAEKTDMIENEFLISEVIESGYRLSNDTGDKVIMPARVRIYKIAQGVE